MTINHLDSVNKTALLAPGELEHSPDLVGMLLAIGKDGPPPPHRQLLSDEPVSYEGLKGYDHTQEVRPYENSYETLDPYDEANGTLNLERSFRCWRTLWDVKKDGGESWLLGLTHLREQPTLSLVGDEEEDTNPPSLICDEDSSSDSEDDASAASEEETHVSKMLSKRRGVSFDAAVAVQPIPHSSDLSPIQRRRMYCSRLEIHQNKMRNKKEFRYDGCDWRNATEEWGMGVDMVTGELVHPAHQDAMVHPAPLPERLSAGGWR